MIRTAATAFVLSFGLAAACTPRGTPPPPTDDAQPRANEAMLGGATSSVRLLPLTEPIASKAEGELRCAFTEDAADNTLFLAAANVGSQFRATGVVNNRGEGVVLVAADKGGFGALRDGGRFDSQTLTAKLEPGEEKTAGIGEQTEAEVFPARLTVTAKDGTEVIADGTWTCGP